MGPSGGTVIGFKHILKTRHEVEILTGENQRGQQKILRVLD